MTDNILFQYFVNSIYAGLMVVVILVIRRLIKGKVPHRCICMLWIMVMLRLIIPMSFETEFGILPEASEIIDILESIDRININRRSSVTPENGYYGMDENISKKDEMIEMPEMYIETEHTDGDGNVHDTSLSSGFSKINILSVVWFAGCGIIIVYIVISLIITTRRLRFAVPEVYRFRISLSDSEETDVKVYLDESVNVPFLFGFFRPKIYLPYNLSQDEAVHIIRHELAHVKRHDQIIKPIFFLVLAMYWYNPLVWAAFKMFSLDMEIACDERVVDEYDDNLRNGYVQALVNVAGGGDKRLPVIPFGKAPVGKRIQAVLQYKRIGPGTRLVVVPVMVLIAVIFSAVRANAGFDDIVITDYSIVIPVIDEASGERYLLVPYNKNTDVYEMITLNDSLETEVKENSNEYWYERPLSEYTIRENEENGLSYIVKNGEAVWEGHVLLHNDRDCRKYEAMAQDYAGRYADVIPEADIGYSYADYEVKGLGGRCENGFWFLQTGTLMYIDVDNPVENGWRFSLTTDEYMKLEKWLSDNGTPDYDVTSFDAWKSTFDSLDIEYDIALDPESRQYQAAVRWLEKGIGDFPSENMSEEQAEEQIRYAIKSFDEDGDYTPFGSVPGMLVTEENDKDRRTIISIPDDIRQMMFELCKEEFLKWNGMSADTESSSVFRAYQEQAPKEDRLKGSWTLEQYERMYKCYFEDAIRQLNPDWDAGDDFDKDIIRAITRIEVEKNISSDGSELSLIK